MSCIVAPRNAWLGPNREVAVVKITHPPVNALAPSVLKSLADVLDTLHSDTHARGVIITGDGAKFFSAGFDINAIKLQQKTGKRDEALIKVNSVLNGLVESGRLPVVAAVNGPALGGGCEIAMACAARVAIPQAKLGLPELTLGIIPGFGGTQRMPRLVGIETAIKLMLTSKPLKADEARRCGLVDEVVPLDALMLEAARIVLEIADGRRERRYSLRIGDKMPRPGTKEMQMAVAMVGMAKESAKKKQPNLVHPGMCIDAVLEGVQYGSTRGLEKEAEVFEKLLFSDTSRALVHTFFASRGTGRVVDTSSGSGAAVKVPAPARVAVIGGGLMGSGIATACVLAGIDVILKEVNAKSLDAGIKRVSSNITSAVKKGRLRRADAEAAMSRLRGTLSYDGFGAADIVIEAVVERLDVKRSIFAELEKICSRDCILSSNTSTISIAEIGAKLSDDARMRLCGAHFFSPAHVMPLLEIVRSDETAATPLRGVVALGRKIGKTPVVVGNCTGFCVNRVFFPYTMAACLLVDAGLDPYVVDKAVSAWGMPMGPFRLTDLVGGDIGMHVASSYIKDFSERVYESRLIPLMNDAGRLGEKTGKGFYSFELGRGKAKADAEGIAPLVNAARREARVSPAATRAVQSLRGDLIVEALMFPVVNEACRVLSEGIVDSASDLDVCTVLGMGFPAYRGGVLHWADSVGAKTICARLEELARLFGGRLTGFFAPCAHLQRCAKTGAKLSETTAGLRPRL